MKLSLVVPCYNEADNVALFQQAVISAFDGCGYDYEIVFIDDGSRDATLHNLKKLYAAQECPVKVVLLPEFRQGGRNLRGLAARGRRVYLPD